MRNQYLATITINLLSISYGTSVGWTSSAFLLLESDETPLSSGPLTSDEISWIGSIFCFSGILATIATSFLTEYFGKKTLLILFTFPQIISWTLVITAKNVIYLYVSRIFFGIITGGIFVLIPLFVTEIADDKHRGSLGSFLTVFSNFGILLGFIVGNYLDFVAVALFHLSIPIIFLGLFIFFPDTPYHYVRVNETELAKSSFKFYRGGNSNDYINEVNEIFDQIKTDKEKNSKQTSFAFSNFNTRASIRAILLSTGIMLIYELAGVIHLITYTATIFAESGSSYSPNTSAIIVGTTQLIGSIFATNTVDVAGRRFLFLFSTIGSGLSLFILGTYMYLSAIGYDLQFYSWIAIASFSACLFLASCGIISLPWIIVFEILPENVRSIGGSICLCESWTFTFLLIKFFPPISAILGMYGCIYVFSIFSLSSAVFIYFCLPETKGKSYADIFAILDKH